MRCRDGHCYTQRELVTTYKSHEAVFFEHARGYAAFCAQFAEILLRSYIVTRGLFFSALRLDSIPLLSVLCTSA